MEHSFFHRLGAVLWALLLAIIVGLALYVGVGRVLLAEVANYQPQILQLLNKRLPLQVDADQVVGQWRSFNPELVLKKLRLTLPESSDLPLQLNEGRVTIDVWQTLLSRSLQIKHLRLDGLSLHGQLTRDGRFHLVGLQPGSQTWQGLEDFLLNLERVQLSGNTLRLTLPDRSEHQLAVDLTLTRAGPARQLEAEINGDNGTSIKVIASGVGNPFTPSRYRGDFYVNASHLDVTQLLSLAPRLGTSYTGSGEVAAELWLAWKSGVPNLVGTVAGRQLRFAATDQSWQLPLDSLGMQIQLQQHRNRLTLFASDINLSRGDAGFSLPRLQLDLWGDSLQLRALELPLGPVAALASQARGSAGVLQVLGELHPAGKLTALALRLEDINLPAAGWEVSANVEQVAVAAWRGAPAVNAATGYVELRNGGGEVILDSESISLAFPQVYRQPLVYESVYGSVELAWDDEHLVLSSGLINAVAEEGHTRLRFGLTVPFSASPAGVELELLVGLQNSHPDYRNKYLPYKLNPALLNWLDVSLGEGLVRQAGFLWRGSLRPGAADLRTVQLFVDVSDMKLDYHPDWPALAAFDAVAFVDDAAVSVWSEHAALYRSRIDSLTAEVWRDKLGAMQLKLAGSVRGPAADGLRVVNNSPLAQRVRHALDEWSVRGKLATQLQLELPLGAAPRTPTISLATQLENVEVDINPGDLTLLGINGDLKYTTALGFSAPQLSGELWGRPFSATLAQGARASPAVDASTVMLDVDATIDVAQVQQWLLPGQAPIADGVTPAQITLQFEPAMAPVLSVASQLDNIRLALPSPLAKAPATALPFALRVPLGGSGQLLQLNLGRRLEAAMDITGGQLRAAAVGLQQDAAKPISGVIAVAGHVSSLDADAWLALARNRLSPGVLTNSETTADLGLHVDDLQLDTLLLGGQDLRNVMLNVARTGGRWRVAAESAWLRGTLELATDLASGELQIEYLDLAELKQLRLAERPASRPLQLPRLDVAIAGLEHAGRPLGELGFTLDTEGETLRVEAIRGTLAGLRIDPDAPANLYWRQGGSNPETEINARLQFGNLGDTLAQFGYAAFLESKRGQFELALRWPGGPQSFSLPAAEGILDVAIGGGRFLNVAAGASNTLRVVTILNLADILQRMSLSQMFESGVPFDRIDGEVVLHNGVVEVPSIEVDGASSSFQFSGISPIASETLDGELVVTLPVASNLPWVAALAGGLPVAAGVFVVSKVFEKQMNRFSSAIYRLDGSWDDPQIKFNRIFDTRTTRGQQTPTANVPAESGPQVDPPPEPGSPEDS